MLRFWKVISGNLKIRKLSVTLPTCSIIEHRAVVLHEILSSQHPVKNFKKFQNAGLPMERSQMD